MKKSILKLLCGFSMATATLAQAQYTIPNGGFETWTADKPNSWNETFSTDHPTPFTKSTDAHTGTFAMQLLNQAANGIGAELKLPKAGNNLPQKLKGFVKYNIAPGQRARITLSLAKTKTSGTSSSTTYDNAGWVSFSGSSNNNYVPFEIILDYRLVKQHDSLPNGGIDFDELKIEVESFGPLHGEESFFGDINNPQILANTFITVDDLSFEGSVPNEKFTTADGLPDGYETWVPMDGGFIPLQSVLSGVNAASNAVQMTMSRSTDAKTGNYALQIALSGADSVSGFLTVFEYQQGQKELNFSVKGSIGTNDSISLVVIDTSFSPVGFLNVIGNELTSAYKTFSIDISKCKPGQPYIVFVAFKKASQGTYSVLFDDFGVDRVIGIKDMTYLNNVQATPNPSAGGIFTLTNASDKRVILFNQQGHLAKAAIVENGTDLNIDLSALSKGIYFVNIDGLKTIKVINE